MISFEEAKKVEAFMDEIFKFKIGDFLQAAVMGDYVDAVTGISKMKKDAGDWMYSLSYRDGMRYQVFERLLQQCHGGAQKHYVVRIFNRDGATDGKAFHMAEHELVKSGPFHFRDGMTEEEIRSYPDQKGPRPRG
jgi:hypothetical protein